MSEGWKYRCIDWALYLGINGLLILAGLPIVCWIIPTIHFEVWWWFVLVALLVFHKVQSDRRKTAATTKIC